MSKKRKHADFQQAANGGVAGKTVDELTIQMADKSIEESPQVERKMKVILDEISVTGSNIYGAGTFATYNPDDLVGKKGLEIYKKMRIDDQIKAVLTMKKMAMLSTGWDIHAASQEAEDIEKRDFVKNQLDNLVGTLEDHLYNIFTGYDFGFSLSELVYYRIEKGQWAGRIGLKAIKTREPFNYLFDADEHGNLADDGIVYIGALPSWTVTEDWQKEFKRSGIGQRYPVQKFIIFSYSKEFSNWYGTSDLRSAYRSFWSKELLIRFMNIYGERFGMPTHVGKVPPGTPKPDRDDLKKVLDQVQSKYAIVIPNDIAIDLLQAGSGGWEGYRSAIEMHNKFIARSILVPDLMGYTEMTGGGAYALGKKQFDMFLWIINRGQRDVEESIMGEQVIKRLVDLNWADTENYPKFKFGSITEEGSVAKSQILAMALTSGLVNREEGWVRDYLGLPARDPNMELPPMQVPGAGAGLPPAIEERLKGLEGKVDEVKGFFTEFKRKLILDFQEKKELKTVKVKPTKFDKKLNYVELRKTLDDYEEESVDSMSAVVKRMRDDMVRFVRRRRIVEDKDAAAINKLQVKYVGDLKRDIEARLVKLYLDSKLNAAKMLQESGVGLEIVTKFQEISIPEWEPVPPVDAIDFFKKKVLVKVVKADGTKVLVELASGKILEYYTQKAFYVAGVERDYILKEAKASLLASLRDGDSVDKAMFNLSNVFDKYIERGELDDEGELVTPHRLETIVRTNFSEAYNRGTRDFVKNNDIVDFVPAWQYTAILDSRVRPLHAEMHGTIWRADDPVIDRITPPNGFQCRCSLLPITVPEIEDLKEKGEGLNISSEADIPEGFPDTGFKSFSENNASPVKVDEDGKADGDHEDFIRFDPNSTSEWGHYRLINPASFKKDSMTTWDSWAGIETKGIKFIVGELKDSGEKAIQAVRFDKDKWTEDRASDWWNTHKDKFEKSWTQSDWDKTKYTVTYNGLTSEPSTYAEAKGYQKAVKMMGGGDVEMVEISI